MSLCGLYYYSHPRMMVYSLVSDKITETQSAGSGNDGKIAHIPSEQFHLQPISSDQNAIPQGEKRAQVSTPPEQECRNTTGGKLSGWLKPDHHDQMLVSPCGGKTPDQQWPFLSQCMPTSPDVSSGKGASSLFFWQVVSAGSQYSFLPSQESQYAPTGCHASRAALTCVQGRPLAARQLVPWAHTASKCSRPQRRWCRLCLPHEDGL